MDTVTASYDAQPFRIEGTLGGHVHVVCPSCSPTVATELAVRRIVRGLLVGWAQDTDSVAVLCHYAADSWDPPRGWVNTLTNAHLVGIIAMTFRGCAEDFAVGVSFAIISRIEHDLPTIIGCSIDPSMLKPRYHGDEVLLNALRRAPVTIRTDGVGHRCERRQRKR
jgi:hypothetical protein